MGKLFNLDAPLMQALSKIGQMMIHTVLWLLCCLPVVTIGAATATLCRMMFNLKEHRSCTVKDFFRAFRENFRKATVLWLIFAACAVVLAGLFYLVVLVESAILRMAALAVFSVLFFAVFITGLYIFPLTAYFENTVPATIRNALGMGMGNLRQTVIASAVTLLPLVAMLASMKLFVQMMFLWLVLGPGAIAYGAVCALTPVFRRYIPGEGDAA